MWKENGSDCEDKIYWEIREELDSQMSSYLRNKMYLCDLIINKILIIILNKTWQLEKRVTGNSLTFPLLGFQFPTCPPLLPHHSIKSK